jgi:hypothetical protein
MASCWLPTGAGLARQAPLQPRKNTAFPGFSFPLACRKSDDDGHIARLSARKPP